MPEFSTAYRQNNPPMYPPEADRDEFEAFVEWFDVVEPTDITEVLQEMCIVGYLDPEVLEGMVQWYLWPEIHFDHLDEFDTYEDPNTKTRDVFTSLINGLLWIDNDFLSTNPWEADRYRRGEQSGLASMGLVDLMFVEQTHGGTREWARIKWPQFLRRWREAKGRIASQFSPDGYVYLLGGGGYYKIGRSKSVGSRVRQLAIQLPFPVELIHHIPCEDYVAAEKELHELYDDSRLNGEWFTLSERDVTHIKAIVRMRGGRMHYGGEW